MFCTMWQGYERAGGGRGVVHYVGGGGTAGTGLVMLNNLSSAADLRSDHAGQAAHSFALVWVSLLWHRRAADLALLESLKELSHLSPLQITDLLGQALDRSSDGCDGEDVLGDVQPRDHLSGPKRRSTDPFYLKKVNRTGQCWMMHCHAVWGCEAVRQ